jgi:DNA-binding IclR family transcriptional regulator
MASTIYDVQIASAPGVPPTLAEHVTVMRHDGKALTREELEALAAAYPAPPAEGRAAVEAAIAAASPAPAGKARTKATATKPGKATTKRAAKRP